MSASAPTANLSVKQRSGYLGGSDAAAVLGVSPWRTPYRLWAEKVGLELPPNLDEVEYVYFGNILEPIVASEFERRLGKKIRAEKRLLIHPKHKFLAGHIDRLVLKEKAFLECKVANAFDYKLWGADGGDHHDIPEYYLAQVDHYMSLRPFTHCYVAVLIGGSQFRHYLIARSEERIAKLQAKEVEFWEQHVVKDDPPPITNEADSKSYWKKVVEGSTILVDQTVRSKLVTLSALSDEVRAKSKTVEALRDELFPIFQDKEHLADQATGEVLARLSSSTRSHFDIKAARADKRAKKWVDKFTEQLPSKRLKILI